MVGDDLFTLQRHGLFHPTAEIVDERLAPELALLKEGYQSPLFRQLAQRLPKAESVSPPIIFVS